jgi:hypothetical protein
MDRKGELYNLQVGLTFSTEFGINVKCNIELVAYAHPRLLPRFLGFSCRVETPRVARVCVVVVHQFLCFERGVPNVQFCNADLYLVFGILTVILLYFVFCILHFIF